MEDKIILIILFSLTASILVVLWNTLSIERLRKTLKEGKNLDPDEKYFELKYKIQYMGFAGTLILAFVGALGYSNFKDIKTDLKKNLDEMTDIYNKKMLSQANYYLNQTDTLLRVRIDNTNKAFSDSYDSLNKDLNDSYNELNSEVVSARKEVAGYNEKMKMLNERIGYNKLYVIDEYKLTNLQLYNKVIPFKNLGFNNLKTIPTVFVSPKTDFNATIKKVTQESLELEVKNAKTDTVSVGILLFVK
ncbi:MAG TPA: hypothetical protein VHO03_08105 [Ignavibacteriales bacterium]|nr:hypothetical protein [Ignavibacteriales bacterium]